MFVTEVELDAGPAQILLTRIDSGEVDVTGHDNGTMTVLSYGYFRSGQEILKEASMKPDFRLQDSEHVVLQQTPEQIHRARSSGAEIRVALDLPSPMSILQSRLENGTLSVRGITGMDVSLNSGTVQASSNKGATILSLGSGTVSLAGPTAGFRHQIVVGAGTVKLAAGWLLPLVQAEVMQGVIQGDYEGRLERLGMSGWRLVPIQVDPETSIQCRVSTGTIMLAES
jgi:hypothetical protein